MLTVPQHPGSESGFTLLEILVVIVIIGVLAGVVMVSVSNARSKSRDAKRAADIRQTITALDQFLIQHGTYPTGTASVAAGGTAMDNTNTFNGSEEPFVPNYLPMIPSSPKPADGNCASETQRGGNVYWYEAPADGLSYSLTFCLGRNTSAWSAGMRIATPNGIQ